MAACDLDELISDAACFKDLGDRKLREILLFSLLVDATVVDPTSPSSMSAVPALVSCWINQSQHALLSFAVVSAQNAYSELNPGAPFPYSLSEMLDQVACITGMSDQQVNAAIVALNCRLLSNLPSAA